MLYENEARELFLFMENDRDIYCRYLEPIEQNFIRKANKGIFDAEKAGRAYIAVLREAAKKYCRFFGGDWRVCFPSDCRRECAALFVEKFVSEMPYLMEA